jgi:hypothetical protein
MWANEKPGDESSGTSDKGDEASESDKTNVKQDPRKSGEAKKAFQKDKDFRRWFHKEYKEDVKSSSKDRSNPDIDLQEGYDQWLAEGKPKVD